MFKIGKRTYESDIIAMALLYRKQYVGTDMLSYDKALEFDAIINENLDNMNSKFSIGPRCEQTTELYRILQDENGNIYAVINPNTDLKKAWEWHIGCLPIDVVIAAHQENALKTIGLRSVDGKLTKQENHKVKQMK